MKCFENHFFHFPLIIFDRLTCGIMWTPYGNDWLSFDYYDAKRFHHCIEQYV